MSSRAGSVRGRIERIGRWLDTPDVDLNTKSWLMAAGVIVVISALLRQPILTLIAVAIAAVALTVRVWWDQCFRGLTYTRKFSTVRAFHGDEISLDLEVVNAKPLPITRLEVSDSATINVEILNRTLEPSENHQTRTLRSLFSLGMYERVNYRYRIACRSRGWHRFGPVVLSASDPLGLVVRRETQKGIGGFLVYPRIVPITHLVVPARQPFGDFTPQQSLVEDPMRMAGVREYVPGDSPKRVHWRATARTGTMQTRIYEPSASPVAAIFLDTINFSYLWEGQNSALLELAVTTAASLANQLLSGRHQVGLYANAPMPGRSRSVRVPPGRRSGQLTRILEDLAMLMPAFGERIERMVVEELPRLPWGSTIVIVTCRVTEGMQRSLLRLARSSGTQRFVIIAIGATPELVP
ncbi:MAG: DUF58 domain-containing protein, partial [Chloroflexota bacterium]|nr:DUF58 domain-containing protein [Chloroflexota bacterium]